MSERWELRGREAGRELEEEVTHTLPERLDEREEAISLLYRWSAEEEIVGDPPGELEEEAETRRGLLNPAGNSLRARARVEGRIPFNT